MYLITTVMRNEGVTLEVTRNATPHPSWGTDELFHSNTTVHPHAKTVPVHYHRIISSVC